MIERVLEEAENIDWGDENSVIDFYESQYLFFNNYKSLTETEDIIEIAYIKTRYIEHLIGKKHYKKALEIVSHLDFLIDKVKERPDDYKKLYEENMFHNGLLNSRLKNYTIALDIFKKLVEIDKDNDLYRSWLVHCKLDVRYNYLRIFSYTGLAIVFGNIISDLAFNYEFNRTLTLLGYILLLSGWLLPLVLKKIEKKKE